MTETSRLAEEVQALTRLDLEGLRAFWRERFGTPPRLRSPDLLRRLIAWRLQVEAYGGLEVETRRLLRQAGPGRGPRLDVGARIAREWKGVRHEVDATEGGYRYNGRTYASLSEVARSITGVRWNGPRFFGLRQDHAA